jgi:hypothetical protein
MRCDRRNLGERAVTMGILPKVCYLVDSSRIHEQRISERRSAGVAIGDIGIGGNWDRYGVMRKVGS